MTSPSALIPRPRGMRPESGGFTIEPGTGIVCPGADGELLRVAEFLATVLRRSTGFEIPVSRDGDDAGGSIIAIALEPGGAHGDEGYDLTVSTSSVNLTANRPAGIFRGMQTIRQLLPPQIEATTPSRGPWPMPGVTIRDVPRYPYRGMMLDVARHFFGVAEVKRVIDFLAYYKFNVLHLHLTDDQGWRIEIESWPELALHGGSTQVGGGPGGFFTKAQYRELVDYAAERFITVIPEIGMPGHTRAARASYGELNDNGVPSCLHTGIDVLSHEHISLTKPASYRFADEVIGEVAALTPGPYIHVGGDESEPGLEYGHFIEKVEAIVRSHGKRMVGWDETAEWVSDPQTVVQLWRTDGVGYGPARWAAARGSKIIMSHANEAYLDMKYNEGSRIGTTWARCIDVDTAYCWDPGHLVNGIEPEHLLGVEAALWTEQVKNAADLDYLVFPRLPGYGELGWTAPAAPDWEEYAGRLAAHGPVFEAMGIDFYRSEKVKWP